VLWGLDHGAGHFLLLLYDAKAPNCQKQTPPDLVVKFQPIDIVDVILWLVVRLRVVYQREIKG
jgi:hypothetical protein